MRLKPRWLLKPSFHFSATRPLPCPRPIVGLRARPLTTASSSKNLKTQDAKPRQMMWERVVPASARMLDFLASEQAGSADRLVSAFQLMRFHLCRNDLRSAKELLYSLLDGSSPVEKKEELRPLFRMLMDAYARTGDAAGAISLRNRMTEAALPLSRDIYMSLLRACTESESGVSAEEFMSLLEEGAGTGWSEMPEACAEVLFMLARLPPGSASSLPSIESQWATISAAGQQPPPLRSIAARVQAVAAHAQSSAVVIDTLSPLLPPTRVLGLDIPMVQKACAAAARAMIRLGDASGLRQALEVIPLSEQAYANLLRPARLCPPELALPAVIASFCDPTGPTAILETCRLALAEGDEASVSKAISKALRLSASDWAQTTDEEVAQLLDSLQARGGQEEAVRALAQAAAARRKTVPAPLVKSLLRFAATEGQPGRALPLLRKLGTQAAPEDYHQVLAAVGSTKFPPRSARERSFVEDPASFLKWVLSDMKTRGLTAETATVNAALNVFLRSCEWVDYSAEEDEEASSRSDAMVDAALDLVNACAKGGGGRYEVSKAIEPDDDTFVGLVRVAVFAKSLRRADRLVQQMEQRGAALETLDRAYTPYVCAVLLRGGGALEGEQVMVRMVNNGLSPNGAIMDAFAEAYRRADNVPSALSFLQGCFNQYGCRPSPDAFLALVHHCVEKGDRYEAERAVAIADQFWAGADDIRADIVQRIGDSVTKLTALPSSSPQPPQEAEK